MTARITADLSRDEPGRTDYRVVAMTRAEVQDAVTRLMNSAEDAGTAVAEFTTPQPHRHIGFVSTGFIIIPVREDAA